ncbi:uncharacterized protein conserved in bacteria [Zymobacter palmae]|uniref:Uncharacterized protein conserved in bacteria n=1 Tax=Zymobacter palmae TaxID=33074 RepID=A0A348HBY7_9GAMM|nr:uncharacterized protein conserved in bacteria [Zymobacter palmae]
MAIKAQSSAQRSTDEACGACKQYVHNVPEWITVWIRSAAEQPWR